MVARHMAAIGVFLTGIALAQDSATLTVTVLDPSQASVPGAKVTLKGLSRGGQIQGETNENGFVVFDTLQPGEYSLDAESMGFDKYHIGRFTLNVRDRQNIRLQLKITEASATKVEVNARPQTLSSDAAQGISLDQQYVQNLPANGRNVESLILMAPGISSAAGGRGGDGGFNANGLRSNTNYYTVDGVSLNRPVGGGGGPGPGGGGPGAASPGAGSSTEILRLTACRR